MSILQLSGHSATFVNPHGLDAEDWIAAGISVVFLGGYHWYYWHTSRTHMHSSLSSHVDFSRISWAKFIYYDYKNKVTTVQNFRSALLIVGFLIQLTATMVASVALAAVREGRWSTWTLASVRTITPTVLLVGSLMHIMLTLMAYRYLHFHTQIEDLSVEEYHKFGIPHDTASAEQAKLGTAALALQCNVHFRFGWRMLLAGLVFTLWGISPWCLLVGSVSLTFIFYVNDFPFSTDLQNIVEHKEQEVELELKRVELLKVFHSLPS